MSATSISQTLAASELAAVRAFLQFQGTFNTSKITSVTNADIGTYFGWLDSLSAAYGSVQNAPWKGWYDQLFAILTATDDFPEMYQVLQFKSWVSANEIEWSPYMRFLKNYYSHGWYGFWYAFQHGFWWTYTAADNKVNSRAWEAGQSVPAQPPIWQSKVQGVVTRWGDSPPSNMMGVSTDFTGPTTFDEGQQIVDDLDVLTSAQAVLNNWTAFPTIVGTTTAIGQSQLTSMAALLQPDTLAADAYFFLLHLLLALPAGDEQAQRLAAQVASALATSSEYPNDTFANQLVYLALLYLADPNGSYVWDNAQLQAALHDLEGTILASDPASTALHASLVQHGKLLYTDAAYPMQDPNSPSISFSQRKTDTLFALDKARQALQQ
jgi:hypothetical protein